MERKDYERLKEFAASLGYPYIEPVSEKASTKGYYVCLTKIMKECPNGKFGSPKIIAINKKTKKPYLLSRDDVGVVCQLINNS